MWIAANGSQVNVGKSVDGQPVATKCKRPAGSRPFVIDVMSACPADAWRRPVGDVSYCAACTAAATPTGALAGVRSAESTSVQQSVASRILPANSVCSPCPARCATRWPITG